MGSGRSQVAFRCASPRDGRLPGCTVAARIMSVTTSRSMRLSTRLLLPLLAAVAVVMSMYAVWAVWQREATLTAEARRETRAYAFALGLAIELAYRDAYLTDVQEIIDRLSRERSIYGVFIYDLDNSVRFRSDPLQETDAAETGRVEAVLRGGQPAEFEREIGGDAVYSVLRPIRDPLGDVLGVFEVAQPLSLVRQEIASTRWRFLLNTLTLLLAITVIILSLVRGVIGRPLAQLLTGVRALGQGDLAHRVGDVGPRELAEMAAEFNGMAERLERARTRLMDEADERVQLERRLRETEKLAAVGNIAAGLAHEVGAPLHVVRGRAEMILRRGGLREDDRRNLGIIVGQIGRITRIVQNLLDFTRRREPRVASIDIVPLVEGVAEFLDGEFERVGVTFRREGPAQLFVNADPHLMHQVFINLLVNALQALDSAPVPREIVVRVAAAPQESKQDAEDGMSRPMAIIEVSDTGPGIPADLLDGIFAPFFTTKSKGEGTGLGLAVVKSIIDEHGGRITAANRDGGGAVFRIHLPAAVPAPAHA